MLWGNIFKSCWNLNLVETPWSVHLVAQAASATDRWSRHHCRDWWGMDIQILMKSDFLCCIAIVPISQITSVTYSSLTFLYIATTDVSFSLMFNQVSHSNTYSNLKIKLPLQSLLAKRKYNRGHKVGQKWVFGGICQHGRGFMQVVPDRDAPTLIPIIREHIAPGTIINSWVIYV